MKKTALFASAIAIAFATPAVAAEIDINLQATAVDQVQNGDVTQAALSVAAAVGSTGNNVDVSSTAVNAAQIATMDLSVAQGSGGEINGSGMLTGMTQTMNGVVDQASASIAGTGDLGGGSSISSTAANLGQSASVSVRVRQ